MTFSQVHRPLCGTPAGVCGPNSGPDFAAGTTARTRSRSWRETDCWSGRRRTAGGAATRSWARTCWSTAGWCSRRRPPRSNGPVRNTDRSSRSWNERSARRPTRRTRRTTAAAAPPTSTRWCRSSPAPPCAPAVPRCPCTPVPNRWSSRCLDRWPCPR